MEGAVALKKYFIPGWKHPGFFYAERSELPVVLISKSHNVSILLYHFVCSAKYCRVVFNKDVDETLKDICLEIGTDKDHVH